MSSHSEKVEAGSRRLFLAPFLAALLLIWAAAPLAADKDKNVETKLAVGETFELRAPDQGGSTGYVVMLKTLPAGLALVSMEFTPPAENLPGAPGERIFTFMATAPGEGLLEIGAARPWEKPLNWKILISRHIVVKKQ